MDEYGVQWQRNVIKTIWLNYNGDLRTERVLTERVGCADEAGGVLCKYDERNISRTVGASMDSRDMVVVEKRRA